MCLCVSKSHVRTPIPEVECAKILEFNQDTGWVTPFQLVLVPVDTGWFMPIAPSNRATREYRRDEVVQGGYLHAYTVDNHCVWWSVTAHGVFTEMPSDPESGVCYRFRAYARNVVAVGEDSDLVCRALYIPAFDLTGQHRNAILDM